MTGASIRRGDGGVARNLAAIVATGPGRGTGAAAVLEQLLLAWDPRCGRLIVVAPPGSRAMEAADRAGHAVAFWHARSSALAESLYHAARFDVRALSCRVVHAWHARDFEIARLLRARTGRPAACTLHDHPLCATHGPLRRFLIRTGYRRFDDVVSVGAELAAAWRRVADRTRVHVIRNGLVDEAPSRAASARPRIGFLGMYGAWKGFARVERWVDAIGPENVEWRLYGGVSAALRPRAEALARRHADRVVLCGDRPTAEIFRDIDILVHASVEFDPFPTVLLEAARAGLPVVASSRGGATEIVEHGMTGFLFDPDDVDAGEPYVRRLLANAVERAALGLAARGKFEREFAAQRMAEEYGKVWQAMEARA